jgi:hypothetical protein
MQVPSSPPASFLKGYGLQWRSHCLPASHCLLVFLYMI